MKQLIPSSIATLLVAVLLGAAGCARPTLAPTPYLFSRSAEDPFTDVPPDHRSSDVQVHYLTDREPIETSGGELRYGFGRSMSLALGTCVVSIGDDLSWESLVAESRTGRRSRRLRLRLSQTTEFVRAPDAGLAFVEIDGERVTNPEVVRQREKTAREVADLLDRRLASSPRKELFIFIHGFNNSFDQAAYRMAQLWHFMSRVGVPVVYSWPAGSPGLLRGYKRDRESGEFTVFHLRQALRFLAGCESVEKMHIVAHSRGCDVAVTALRELHLEYRAAGRDTRTALKLGNLILAAPDLDLAVFRLRGIADGLHLVPERMTIYLSEDDRAIAVASWLNASVRRLGQLRRDDLTPQQGEMMELIPEVSFVDVEVPTDFLGHGYFISNPAVLSDLVLVLRDGREPGRENGRPLEPLGGQFWRLGPDYPRFDDDESE
jgi:esterase/lipase superfamily enzyme